MIIHVLIGKTGEGADYREWMVKAFTTVKAANGWMRWAEYHANKYQNLRKEFCGVHTDKANPYDPAMEMDYTGTFYEIREVDLVGIADKGNS